VAAKDASLLYVAAIALPNILNLGDLENFAVIVDDVPAFLELFDLMMNALGELRDYLFENGFANEVPDFLQLGIGKDVLVLDSLQLILETLHAQLLKVEKNLLDCNSERLGIW
jgi:hypothetical protein